MTDHLAFVGGATGLTGRHVVATLRDLGIRTVAHVRPDSSGLDAHRARFEALGAEVDTTPWEGEAFVATFERLRPTLVFALLGTTRARARRVAKAGGDAGKESYEAVDYGLSAILLKASEAVRPPPRFLYLSSMGVKEGSSNPYLAVRARLEGELKRSGLPYVIARPSFILGDREESRPGEKIGAAVADGLLAAVGFLGATTLRERYRSNDGATLGAALVRLALDPSAAGTTVLSEGLR